ncbi:MAG: NAD-dependent epimerase/dehydratase family protein [Myxococcales bacterium]|nr:NAD-dependent epimerase/dehydratase family protein [Myxococcales bacterium]
MKTLVTGATGFLGSHLMERLAAEGAAAELRVLVRKPTARLTALGVECVQGSVTDAEDVARALEGVKNVYHLAGFVSRKAEDAHEMYKVHVEGTRLLCRAAAERGVARVVMASTSGTVAVSRSEGEMPDEACSAPIDIMGRWAYYASKLYQEEAAKRACRDKVELVTVNPSLLLGPGDERLSSTRDVLSFLAQEIPVAPGGGLNFVDVRDVAAVLPVAMQKGEPGERYLLGGYNWTFREFFGRLERLTKVRGPLVQGRGRWPYFASQLQSAVYKALGRTPPVEPSSVEMGEYFWYFDSAKARRAFDFEPREAQATLFDTVTYLREHFLGGHGALRAS